MEVKTKTYKIGRDTFCFRKSARAFIEFETIADKPLSEMEETFSDTVMFFYACTRAGMLYEKKQFEMTYDEFLDLIDPKVMGEVIKQVAGKK